MNNIYETADGQFIIIGGSEVKFAVNLLTALGRPDLIELAKEEPGPVQDPLKDFLRETFRTKSRAHWEEFLSGLDVCWAPVRSLKDAFDDPHTQERGLRLTDDAGRHHIGVPMKFRHEPAAPDLSLPEYGQHSEALAREAGLPEHQVGTLRRRKVI